MEILHAFFNTKNENMLSFTKRISFYCICQPWEGNLMYLASVLWPSWRIELLSMEA